MRLKLLILTLLGFALVNHSKADSKEFQANILTLRVSEILQYRGEGYKKCARNSGQANASTSDQFHET
jgi:hypothetical protein